MSDKTESCELNLNDPNCQPAKTNEVDLCANMGCAANNQGHCSMQNTECYGYFKPEVEG